MVTSKPAYLISSSGIVTLYMNGRVHSVDNTHVNYQAIVDCLKGTGPYDNLVNLVDVASAIKQKIAAGSGTQQVEVKDGQVWYNNEVVHGTIVDRILQFVREGFDFAPLAKFLTNLMENPSKKSLDNLYRFLDVNQHPITEDGCFLAYKRVRDDYMDMHAGKYNNSVGNVVKMPRNQVEDDPEVTCAPGLHVASLKYARDEYNSGQGRLVVVKVNPKDVVSVPTDYNSAKMRVCEYTVVQDYTNELKQEDVTPKVPTPGVVETRYLDEDYDPFEYAEEYEDDDDDYDDEEEDDEDDSYYGSDDEKADDEDDVARGYMTREDFKEKWNEDPQV